MLSYIDAMVTRQAAMIASSPQSTFAPAFAQGKRPLKVNLLGFALGIHAPRPRQFQPWRNQ